MDYKVGYYMSIGRRNNQEDCIFIDGKILQQDEFKKTHMKKLRGSKHLLAVCDGMGGHSRGEVASRFVCERLKDYLRYFRSSGEVPQPLFRDIQDRIEKEVAGNSGTTVACVALNDGKSVIMNAGDSRIYKIAKGAIAYISHDHSYVQSMLDRGYLSEDEAYGHPHKNVIEFGLGSIFKDIWSGNERQVYVTKDVLKNDEYYLICSDGVNDVLRDDEIYDLLHAGPFDNVEGFTRCLKERMKDNFSFILAGKT